MQLKRTLNRIETVALSVAVIAMMVGMTLNTPFVAGPAGAAVPLVYVISTIGVLCVALSFVLLASKVGHAGSVYGLVRYAQGRNPGFISGWALLLTYTLFVASALFGFGLFASMLSSRSLGPSTARPVASWCGGSPIGTSNCRRA